MGAAIDGTISTDIGINSPDSVSTFTVATPSFCVVADVVPNDATVISTVEVGEICSSLAISVEINDRCAPSSNRMLACVFMFPATMGATAVLRRQVGFWGASGHDRN